MPEIGVHGEDLQAGRGARAFLVGAIAAVACGIPYLVNSTRAFFFSDDWVYLYEALERSPWHVWKAFARDVVFFWRPLPGILMGFEGQLFGLNPAPYILFSFLLHVIAMGLFARFAVLFTNSLRATAIAAVVASSNWIATDAVSWVSDQSVLLLAIFSWIALECWWRATHLEGGGKLRAAAFAAAVLACLCKQSAVCLLPAFFLLSAAGVRQRAGSWRAAVGRFGDWKAEAAALVPILVLIAAYALWNKYYVLVKPGVEILVYHPSPVRQWPVNAAAALSNAALSPLGGTSSLADAFRVAHATPGAAFDAGVTTWFAHLFDLRTVTRPLGTMMELPGFVFTLFLIVALGVAAAEALRGSHLRTLGILFLVLFIPIIGFQTFHMARFYYLPGAVFGLMAACAFRAACDRFSRGRVLWAVLLGGFVVLNFMRLWLMTIQDQRMTEPYRLSYEFIGSERQNVGTAPLFIFERDDTLQHFGLTEMVRLASRQPLAESMFSDERFERPRLEYLHHSIGRVFSMHRDPATGTWSMREIDKLKTLPAL